MADTAWQQEVDWSKRIAKVVGRLAKQGLVYKADESSRLIDVLCADSPVSRDKLLEALGLIAARTKAVDAITNSAASGSEIPTSTILSCFQSEALGKRVVKAANSLNKQRRLEQHAVTAAINKVLHDFVISVLANVTMAIQSIGGGPVWAAGSGGWYIDDPSEYVVCPGFRLAWDSARAKRV